MKLQNIASVAMFFGKTYRNSKEISQFFFKSFATCDKLVFYRKYFDEIVKYRKRCDIFWENLSQLEKKTSQFFFKSFATCDKLVFYRKYFDEIVKYRKRSFFVWIIKFWLTKLTLHDKINL